MKKNNFFITYLKFLLLTGVIFFASHAKANIPPPHSIAFMFQPTPIFTVTKDMSSKSYESGDGSMFKLTNPADQNSGVVDTTVYVTLTIGNRTSADKSIYIRDEEPQGDWNFTSPKSVEFSGFSGPPNTADWHHAENKFFNSNTFTVPARTVAKLKYKMVCNDCVGRGLDKLYSSKVEISYENPNGPFWSADWAYILQPGTESGVNNMNYYDRLYSKITNLALGDDQSYYINDIGYVFVPESRSGAKLFQAPVDVTLEGDSGAFLGDNGYVLVNPGSVIVGDIFGGKKIPAGLNIPGKQAGFAEGNIESQTYYQLPGYKIDSNSVIGWDESNSAANKYMETNIAQLEKVAKRLPDCLKDNVNNLYNLSADRIRSSCGRPNDQFTLDSSSGSATDDWYNPSGVWYAPSGVKVNLGPVTFVGQGTIITNAGISINGIVDEADTTKPVGFIVKSGDVTVANTTIDPIRGAFFVPKGTFDLSGAGNNHLGLVGSFVARDVKLGSPTGEDVVVNIYYDSAIADNPPPGFSLLSQMFLSGK